MNTSNDNLPHLFECPQATALPRGFVSAIKTWIAESLSEDLPFSNGDQIAIRFNKDLALHMKACDFPRAHVIVRCDATSFDITIDRSAGPTGYVHLCLTVKRDDDDQPYIVGGNVQ